jgi:DNA-binding beta-propeller fold protein YncE
MKTLLQIAVSHRHNLLLWDRGPFSRNRHYPTGADANHQGEKVYIANAGR